MGMGGKSYASQREVSLRTGLHAFPGRALSRPQWDTCLHIFRPPQGHPLLSSFELGTLGIELPGQVRDTSHVVGLVRQRAALHCSGIYRPCTIRKPASEPFQQDHESLGRHTWVKVASNSLQASLLVVERGRPASFHAYTTGKEYKRLTGMSPQTLGYHSVKYLRGANEVSSKCQPQGSSKRESHYREWQEAWKRSVSESVTSGMFGL